MQISFHGTLTKDARETDKGIVLTVANNLPVVGSYGTFEPLFIRVIWHGEKAKNWVAHLKKSAFIYCTGSCQYRIFKDKNTSKDHLVLEVRAYSIVPIKGFVTKER